MSNFFLRALPPHKFKILDLPLRKCWGNKRLGEDKYIRTTNLVKSKSNKCGSLFISTKLTSS